MPRGLLEGLVRVGPDPSALLSPWKQEILGLVAEGLSNAEVARKLYLSESTVKQHLRKAYRVLGVKNRREAAAALRGGAFPETRQSNRP